MIIKLGYIIQYDENDDVMPVDERYAVGRQVLYMYDGADGGDPFKELDFDAKYDGLTLDRAVELWKQLTATAAPDLLAACNAIIAACNAGRQPMDADLYQALCVAVECATAD